MTEGWVKCEYCGYENPPNNERCFNCAAPLKHLSETPQRETEHEEEEPEEEEYEEGGEEDHPNSVMRAVIITTVLMMLILMPSLLFGFPIPFSQNLMPAAHYQPPPTFTMFNIDLKTISGLTTFLPTPPDISVYWYHYNGMWSLEGNSDSFDIRPSDDYYAFAVVKSSSNSNYIDYQRIMETQQPLIQAFQYIDIDNDGLREPVFKFDLRQLPDPAQGIPTLAFTLYLLPMSQTASLIASNATTTYTSPTAFLCWHLILDSETSGLAVFKVQVEVNDTTPYQVESQLNCPLQRLLIPQIGHIDRSEMSMAITQTDTLWAYVVSAGSLDGSLYLIGHQAFGADFGLVYFVTGSGPILGCYKVTLTVYYLLPDGAAASVESMAYISAS